MSRSRTTAVLLPLLAAALAAPSSAQVPDSVTAAASAPTRSLADLGLAGFQRAAVRAHPRGTMVAVTVRIPSGSAQDAPGREGTAWLLGGVRAAQIEARLDPARAALTARVERGHTVFTLLVVPDAWQTAWRTVADILFDAPVPAALVEQHRSGLVAGLTFEEGSPARAFHQEAAALLGDPGSAWTRPLRGTPESVAALDPAALDAYRREHYVRGRAAVAVVGPVEDAAGSETPPAPGAQGKAWTLGDRHVLVREVTSTWLAVAYPAPAGMSRTTLELVAHLVLEELDPVPPAPDRFGVEVRIDDAPGGPVLVVEASVLPEAADRWEARITGVVRELAEERMEDDFFRWRRRRFRAARLLEEARPEAEAERVTADLLRDGAPRALGVDIWALDARSLQLAVGSLGEPRILRLGPDLAQP
ncbi:MAG: hypothetical protein RJQ04_20880 [Longimicrobiales bacterium]